MSVAVTHGRTATSVAARRAPPPKKHGERPNLRPRTADLYRWLLAERMGRRPVGNIRALPGGPTMPGRRIMALSWALAVSG
jgi:hypothetical protein